VKRVALADQGQFHIQSQQRLWKVTGALSPSMTHEEPRLMTGRDALLHFVSKTVKKIDLDSYKVTSKVKSLRKVGRKSQHL
jgi:Cu/Ag efflux protein CusF